MREIEFWVIFVIKKLISKYKFHKLSFIHMIMFTLGPMAYYENEYIINTYIHYLELNGEAFKDLKWRRQQLEYVCDMK